MAFIRRIQIGAPSETPIHIINLYKGHNSLALNTNMTKE